MRQPIHTSRTVKKMYEEKGMKYPPQFRPGITKTARVITRAFKSYGRNVAGGARIVGGMIKRK